MHILSQHLMKTHKFEVFGVGGKAWTLLSKKEQRQLKERRNEDLRIVKPVRVLSLERKDQISGERSSLCVVEQFHEAVLCRPMIQSTMMLKDRARRR
ncbi:hypothetical protein H5410_061743 [Solanum commersonii]|uniref:Uncharacterized protein n=1 Tax=Solanum commersonii TaxID=4109 RepID=A0A9J5W8U4_SOLCO|nr:hypothetical protein H5410_061743 [Solanum commersonii]